MARRTPILVGSANGFSTGGTSVSVAKADLPVMEAGDLLVAFIRNSVSAAGSDYSSPGFGRVVPAYEVAAGGRFIGTFTHRVTDVSSEPANYLFSFTSSGTTGRQALMVLLVRGVDSTVPVSGVTGNTPSYFSGTTFDSEVDSLALMAAANEVVANTATEPVSIDPDYTTVSTSSTGQALTVTRTVLWVGQQKVSGISAPSAQGTVWETTAAAAFWGLSLRGIEQVAPTGISVKLGNGATAKLTVVRGDGRKIPTQAKLWLPGFSTVEAALAKQGVTMGHRGASLTPGMAEMSQRSYDYSVMRGYGILEFSTNRTSDGVWVGVHDSSVNRTSETTGLPNVQAMTRAEIAALNNSLNNGGISQPYYDLIPFLDKYTKTHVVMVDPKASVGAIKDFLDLLDTHGGPGKIIVKFTGNSSGGAALSDAAIARGYQTWGYFYNTDIGAGLETYVSRWTVLGMNWDAPQSAWDQMKTYGKKLVGHVCPSQAAYSSAIAKGANIVQCSRPDLITPVSVR